MSGQDWWAGPDAPLFCEYFRLEVLPAFANFLEYGLEAVRLFGYTVEEWRGLLCV